MIYGALLHWKPITHLQNQSSQRTNGTNETKTKISLIILLYIHAIVNFCSPFRLKSCNAFITEQYLYSINSKYSINSIYSIRTIKERIILSINEIKKKIGDN